MLPKFLALSFIVSLGACASGPGGRDQVIAVEISAPGLSPEAIEEAFATPLEKTLQGIPGVRVVHSRMVHGSYLAELEHADGLSPAAVGAVEAAVRQASARFTAKAGAPVVSVSARRIDAAQ